MCPRPRKYNLPDNLTFEKSTGRYRYRNPETRTWKWVGRDKSMAIELAKKANIVLKIKAAQKQLQSAGVVTTDFVITMYIENVVPNKAWDQSTRKNHLFALELYRREFGNRTFVTVDRIFIADWLNSRCKTGDCFNKHRTRMIDLWRYAISRKWIIDNEAEATMKASVSKKIEANKKFGNVWASKNFRRFMMKPSHF